MREWIAKRVLGLVTWILPEGHPANRVIYDAAWTIDDHEWIGKRDAAMIKRLRAALVHIECEPINAEYIARAALDGPNEQK